MKDNQASNTNNFYGNVIGVQIQQGTVNSTQEQSITGDFNYEEISEIVSKIKKYNDLFDIEFGDKAEDLRGKINALEMLVEKRENPNKIKLLLVELKDLAVGVAGSLIASGIAAQIPLL